jgi:hypothetical protein
MPDEEFKRVFQQDRRRVQRRPSIGDKPTLLLLK